MSDPIDRRDWHVANTARAARAAGREVNQSELEREIARQLQLLDAAIASGAIREQTGRRPRQLVTSPHQGARTLAAKAGGEFFARPDRERAPGPLAHGLMPLRGVEKERHIALTKRIEFLSQRSNERRVKPGETIDKAVYHFPAFAVRIAMECLAYQSRLGPYLGLSIIDRYRKFCAAMERIADQSDAVVGVNWWVK